MGDKTTNGDNTKADTAAEPTRQTNQSSENNQTAQAAQAVQMDDEARTKIADYDNLKTRAESAESRLRVLETKDVFTESAAKLKARNPAKLFSLVGGLIEFDENGKPKNLTEVLKQAKEDFPEEFGAAAVSIDGGEKGVENRSGRSVDDFIRGALR